MDKVTCAGRCALVLGVGMLSVFMPGCTDKKREPPPVEHQTTPSDAKHKWDGYGDQSMDSTYDIIDMLDAAPGDLVLVSTNNEWPRTLRREARDVLGQYHWFARGKDSDLVDARLQLNRPVTACEKMDHCEKGSVRVEVLDHYGCYYAEKTHGDPGSWDDGAAVIWCNNLLTVKHGSLLGHTQKDLVDAATEAAWWHDAFMPDGRVPSNNPQMKRDHQLATNRWLIHRALLRARTVRDR